jgi:hypothetical protein
MTEAVNPETIAQADSLQRDSMRGRNAAAILENPVFHEAFEGMHVQLVKAITEHPPTEVDELVSLVQQLKLLDRLKINFVSYVQVGEQANADVERQRKRLAAEQARLDAEENGIFARGMRQAQRVRHALNPRQQ